MTQNNKYTSEDVMKWLGYLYPGEAVLLRELTLSLPENPLVVNIGAGGGTSGLLFLETRDDLTLNTVDIQKESSPYGCLEGERLVLEKAGIDKMRYRQIHGDSKEVCKTWIGKQADLVFIDGNHTYEGCKGDIEGWLPLLKTGGILAIHDYGKTEKAYPGVDESVDELLVNKYSKLGHVDSLIVFRNEKI